MSDFSTRENGPKMLRKEDADILDFCLILKIRVATKYLKKTKQVIRLFYECSRIS
jgi:hypothetical protein